MTERTQGPMVVTDLGCTNSIDVIQDHVVLADRFVIDVGCGDMTFSRQLASAGARVLAIDPDAAQATRHRAAAPIANVRFEEAGAEAIPTSDGSADGVFFSFSLHHVPASVYPAVFAEVLRALKPDGFLCVVEPTGGPLNEVMKLFHDEDPVRDAAQRALGILAVPAFERHAVYRYHSFIQYDSFDAFAARAAGRTFNDGYTEADVRRPEVEATFVRLGTPDHRFPSFKLMMLLEGPTLR